MVATIPTKGAAGSAPEHLPATATSNEIEAALERDGVVVLLDAIDKDTLARINDEVDPCLEATPFGCESGDEAAESFLGDRTKRLNDCLSLAPSLVPLVALAPHRLWDYSASLSLASLAQRELSS